MLDRTQVEKAATALLKHVAAQKSQAAGKSLNDDSEGDVVVLVLALKRIPDKSQVKPILMYGLRYFRHY